MGPQRDACDGKRYAEFNVAVGRKRPVDGRSRLIDEFRFGRQPQAAAAIDDDVCASALALFEQTLNMLGMAPSSLVKFAAFRELLQCIGTCRIKQTIITDCGCDIRVYQRL